MIVVNLFGAPGAGKSQGASNIFSQLKMNGISAELVTEYAKDLTWDNEMDKLQDQLYVFAKQHHRIYRLRDKVDVAITDSPILLSEIYLNKDYPCYGTVRDMIWDIFNSYDNKNYYIMRDKPYVRVGRSQTEEESDEIGKLIVSSLDNYGVTYTKVLGNIEGYNKILSDIIG